jgi:hypothetical protein
MNTKYPVTLNEEQRQYLEKLTSSGKVPARQMKRAQILLKSDRPANWSYEQIRAAFDVSGNTVAAVRRTFIEQGLEAALQRNDEVVKVLRQFKTTDARTNLKHLYPQIQV